MNKPEDANVIELLSGEYFKNHDLPEEDKETIIYFAQWVDDLLHDQFMEGLKYEEN